MFLLQAPLFCGDFWENLNPLWEQCRSRGVKHKKWPGNSNPAHWTTLEKVNEGIGKLLIVYIYTYIYSERER